MRTLIVLALFTAAASAALGQEVGHTRFDPASGDYFVTVMNDAGDLVEMRVVPPNKVNVSVAMRVEPGTVRPFRYAYTVRVNEGSPQPLIFFEVDCPASQVVEKITAIATQNGTATSWNAEQVPSTSRPRCDYDGPGEPLGPGGTLEAVLETILLPAIGEVRAFGETPGVNWPTFDPIPENDPARSIVYSLEGVDGGWKSIAAPVPGRDPADIASPGIGISLVQDDLADACGELGWITNPGICNSLKKKLDGVERSLGQGRSNAAKGQLGAFLNELDAQRGKHLNESAYWLLRTNAQFVLSTLG